MTNFANSTRELLPLQYGATTQTLAAARLSFYLCSASFLSEKLAQMHTPADSVGKLLRPNDFEKLD